MSTAPGAATFRIAADAYDRHVGRYGRALARELIAAAGVRPGDRVLDVGCGPGALTTALAAVVGEEHVAAVEPSETFAAACRERLPRARVVEGAAEALPFGDAEFDHALAQLVVNFMADPLRGVQEMRRVTRAGGNVSAAVWDYMGEMTLLRAFWDAAVALNEGAADVDEGRRMRHCTPDELAELWTAAGLGGVATSSATVTAAYTGFEELWDPFSRGVGPAGAYAVAVPDDHRDALKAELRDRLGAGDEPFELSARAWIVSGSVR